ncbi:MAG: spore maturation protein [Bacteroidetes bacterium]|nr:spore maturation protein [Bacteroidota bacterium]
MRNRRCRRADRAWPDRYHGALARGDARRRAGRTDHPSCPSGAADHRAAISRCARGSSGSGIDDHEHRRQHARPGQCRHTLWSQGHGGARQAQSQERRRHGRDGDLSRTQYFLCHIDPCNGNRRACGRRVFRSGVHHWYVFSRIPHCHDQCCHHLKTPCESPNVSLGAFGGRLMDIFRTIVSVLSAVAIPALMLFFLVYGAFRKVKVYEVAVEGAKEGFEIAVRIIPYLVLMLVSIAIFRASGAMDVFITLVSPLTDLLGIPAEALPMAIMRPLSGSGSLGIMTETMQAYGTDSFIGILVSTLYGSTETTFYVLAVYFGAVGIRNTRHALPTGLLADFIAFLAAVFFVGLVL